jgi:threonine dehydrogenase-like Zn-dependent dehydrogenase
MKALKVTGNKLELTDISRPLANGEVVVRVLKSGICSTDIEIVRGYASFEGVIGHEFVGVVEEAPASPLLVGKRVVGEINAGCGHCGLCRAGDPRHCPNRTVLGIKGRDGAHAQFLKLPAANLFEVPAEISDSEAVFVEPLAAAIGIREQINFTDKTRTAIIGDGKLGLLCALSLANEPGHLILVGKHQEKMRIAEVRGIETVDASDRGKLESGFDVVVEASGSGSGFAAALDLVRPRGEIVLKSTFQGKPTWEAWRVVVDEIAIRGSRCGRFGPALEMLASKKIDVSPLVSDEFALSKGVAAFSRAAEKGALKVLLNAAE